MAEAPLVDELRPDFATISRYISWTKSPLRAIVIETRPLSAGLPLTVCSMTSDAKFEWRLYTAWKYVTFGFAVR